MANSETVTDRTAAPAYAMTKTAEQAVTAIEVKGLQTYLFTRSGVVKAVDDVSFRDEAVEGSTVARDDERADVQGRHSPGSPSDGRLGLDRLDH